MIRIRSLAICSLVVLVGCTDTSRQRYEGTFTTESGDVVTVDKDYRVSSHLTDGVIHTLVVSADDRATLAEADYDIDASVWTFSLPGRAPLTVPEQDQPELADRTALMTRLNDVAIIVVSAASMGVDVYAQHGGAKDVQNTRDDCTNPSACMTINGKKACTNDCTDIGYCNGSVVVYDACCYTHDVCYLVYDCSASSWFSIDWDCQACNVNAVTCMGRKVFGGLDEY